MRIFGPKENNRSFTGIHRWLQHNFLRMWQSFDVIFTEHAVPVLHVTSGHPHVEILTSLRPVVNPLPGRSCGTPVQDQLVWGFYCNPIQHCFSTTFDPREWTMVVLWKEDPRRQHQLFTPENRGDETSSPSPPKLPIFNDPDVPVRPKPRGLYSEPQDPQDPPDDPDFHQDWLHLLHLLVEREQVWWINHVSDHYHQSLNFFTFQ